MSITQYSYGVNTQADMNNNVIDRFKTWTAEDFLNIIF